MSVFVSVQRHCGDRGGGGVKGCPFRSTPIELFNDWGGRGYDDSVPEEVTNTAPSGVRTT